MQPAFTALYPHWITSVTDVSTGINITSFTVTTQGNAKIPHHYWPLWVKMALLSIIFNLHLSFLHILVTRNMIKHTRIMVFRPNNASKTLPDHLGEHTRNPPSALMIHCYFLCITFCSNEHKLHFVLNWSQKTASYANNLTKYRPIVENFSQDLAGNLH